MPEPLILFELHYDDEWNNVDVVLTENHLKYDSYFEGKAEGYHFEMCLDDRVWRVVSDETSFPVPGSNVLWLYAVGYIQEGWSDRVLARDDCPKGWDDAVISVGRMERGVRVMAEAERDGYARGAEEGV